jgi:hypothetical protein
MLWRGLYAGPELQHVNNPGYNQDRGPVLIPGFRMHMESVTGIGGAKQTLKLEQQPSNVLGESVGHTPE